MSFEHLVMAAVAENKETRHRFGDRFNGMSDTAYAIEFCTVALSIGRGTGKTKYILNNAKPWDLVIVPTHPMLQYMRRGERPGIGCPTMTISEYVNTAHWRGQKLHTPRVIYIDEASRISRRELDELYMVVPKHPDQTFILLG